jgi:hypothetical protein
MKYTYIPIMKLKKKKIKNVQKTILKILIIEK